MAMRTAHVCPAAAVRSDVSYVIRGSNRSNANAFQREDTDTDTTMDAAYTTQRGPDGAALEIGYREPGTED